MRELVLLSCVGLRAAFLIGVIGSFSESPEGDCKRGDERVGVLISSHTKDIKLDFVNHVGWREYEFLVDIYLVIRED